MPKKPSPKGEGWTRYSHFHTSGRARFAGSRRRVENNYRTHLPKGRGSFAEQMPTPEVMKPETEFAVVNILAKIIEKLVKVDPDRPEGVVLRAMNKNFVGPETAAALAKGGPVAPANPAELQTPQVAEAMQTLQKKYRGDSAKQDALKCIAAAAANRRPLTRDEIHRVYRNLYEGMNLTPAQWQQIVQKLVQAVQLMKTAGDDCNRKMDEIGKPSVLDLANAVGEGTTVNPDGTLAPRVTQAPVQKPDETTALLEISRDFWMAFFKAGQDPSLHDEMQLQLAQVMRNAGAVYVKTRQNTGIAMQTAAMVDANAHRFLIQKLRIHPMIRADRARMMAVERLARAEETGRAPSPGELVEVFEMLGRQVQMTPDAMQAVLQQMPNAGSTAGLGKMLAAGGGTVNPAEAIRVICKAIMQKPVQTVACLDLFTNLFIAMAATNQNAALRDQHQRLVSETLRSAGQLYGPAQQKEGSGGSRHPTVDVNAYRMTLMKLRTEPQVRSDKSKAKAVEELIAAQAMEKEPTPTQLLEIFKDLGRGVRMAPDMLKAVGAHGQRDAGTDAEREGRVAEKVQADASRKFYGRRGRSVAGAKGSQGAGGAGTSRRMLSGIPGKTSWIRFSTTNHAVHAKSRSGAASRTSERGMAQLQTDGNWNAGGRNGPNRVGTKSAGGREEFRRRENAKGADARSLPSHIQEHLATDRHDKYQAIVERRQSGDERSEKHVASGNKWTTNSWERKWINC